MINSIIKRIDHVKNLHDKEAVKLYIIGLYYNISIKSIHLEPEDISIINKLGIVKRYPNGVEINVTDESVEEIVNKRWQEYRNIFSKSKQGKTGLKPKCLSSKSEVKTKLKKFMTNNIEITFDEILKATNWYVNKFKEKGNYTYMRGAGYFIYKEVVEGGFKILKSELEEALSDYRIEEEENWHDQI